MADLSDLHKLPVIDPTEGHAYHLHGRDDLVDTAQHITCSTHALHFRAVSEKNQSRKQHEDIISMYTIAENKFNWLPIVAVTTGVDS